MTTPDSIHPFWEGSGTPEPSLDSSHRLLVLVPYVEADLGPLIRNVWELANATGAHIQLIGLYGDATEELGLRRQMISVYALVQAGMLSVSAELIGGKDWLGAVKARWQTGDVIVCLAEQRVGWFGKPLIQILQADPSLSLHVLTGLYDQKMFGPSWPARIAVWTGFLAIIVVFLFIQVKIDDLIRDGTHSTWLILSVLVEFWLLWAWNNLFE